MNLLRLEFSILLDYHCYSLIIKFYSFSKQSFNFGNDVGGDAKFYWEDCQHDEGREIVPDSGRSNNYVTGKEMDFEWDICS